ncbi:MAG: membrane dipeptidase [Pseudomonadota bacterium]
MPDPREESLETVRRVLAAQVSVDSHTHLGLWETRGLSAGDDPLTHYVGDERIVAIVQEMIDAGCRAAWINLTSDIPILKLGAPGNKSRDYATGEAWAEYERLVRELSALLDQMPAAIAETVSDIERLNDEGKLALLVSNEGAHMIEEDLARLSELRRAGMTKFQPIHYAYCTVGDAQTDPPVHHGLSGFGREAIAEARRLGMVIDSAHATLETTADMAEVTGGPIMLSHALMQFGDEAAVNARWITEDYARLIADTGGMIGTWCPTHPIGARNAEHFVAAVMAMIDVAGIDHVGWSTDHIEVGMGPWFRDYRDYQSMLARLLEAGLDETDLGKFVGGNALRLLEEAAGTAS